MADNYTTPGPYTFRAVDVGGVLHAVGLVGWGATPTLVSASSGAGLPVQPDAGAVFHVVVDSGSITVGSHAVTNAGTFAVQLSSALPAGSAVIGHVIVDSGTITTVTTVGAVTSITNALPAGTAIIGKVTTDQTTHGTTDLVAADITKVAGSAIAQGHGTAAAAVRVELPTDGTGVIGLIAGTALVGKVGIDQTTPGTTNAVAVIAGQNGVAGGAGAVGATVQRTTLASDDPAVATLGATSGAAVITDANGTLQQYLRGLVKLAITAGGVNVTKAANNQTLTDGSAISWQASGGTYALTCTSVTNNNGRQGAKGDLGATRAQRYAVQVTFSVGSAATNGLEIEVYWAASPSATAGTSNPGGTSGTDATFNTTPDEYKLQLQFIGSLVLSNNAGTGIQTANLGPFTPRFRYGMPICVNKSGQTLGATAGDHTVVLYPMQDAG